MYVVTYFEGIYQLKHENSERQRKNHLRKQNCFVKKESYLRKLMIYRKGQLISQGSLWGSRVRPGLVLAGSKWGETWQSSQWVGRGCAQKGMIVKELSWKKRPFSSETRRLFCHLLRVVGGGWPNMPICDSQIGGAKCQWLSSYNASLP